MIKKLTASFVEDTDLIRKKLEKSESILFYRINYIIDQIFKECKEHRHSSYTQEEVIDSFWELYPHEYVYVVGGLGCCAYNLELIVDGTKIDVVENGFPLRWLFENFEKELKEARKKYLDNAAEEKVKLKQAAKKKKMLLTSAKKKLSKEELEVLKL